MDVELLGCDGVIIVPGLGDEDIFNIFVESFKKTKLPKSPYVIVHNHGVDDDELSRIMIFLKDHYKVVLLYIEEELCAKVIYGTISTKKPLLS